MRNRNPRIAVVLGSPIFNIILLALVFAGSAAYFRYDEFAHWRWPLVVGTLLFRAAVGGATGYGLSQIFRIKLK